MFFVGLTATFCVVFWFVLLALGLFSQTCGGFMFQLSFYFLPWQVGSLNLLLGVSEISRPEALNCKCIAYSVTRSIRYFSRAFHEYGNQ